MKRGEHAHHEPVPAVGIAHVFRTLRSVWDKCSVGVAASFLWNALHTEGGVEA